MKILLIEDDKLTRITLRDALAKVGHQVATAADGGQGLEAFARGGFEVVVTDLRLPGVDGLEILAGVKAAEPEVAVILITGYATVETAVEALKQGAFDYLTKPFNPDELIHRITQLENLKQVLRENRKLRAEIEAVRSPKLLGVSPARRQLAEMIRTVAPRHHTVLLEGESGTGKEVVARNLHQLSPRCEQPFVAVNCAAIPESLLESELFGHEKGAFSGALKRHPGYFERADGGTIFIDDVDDLPLPPQVRLLRVLQERRFSRVGGTSEIAVDIRVICSTKVDLWQHVTAGRFREDLFFRLNIVPIKLPPLRETRADIPLLAEHFLTLHEAGDAARRRVPELLDQLMAHDWPGNIRELENVVQRIIALPEVADLGLSPARARPPAAAGPEPPDRAGDYPPYLQYIERKDREIIEWALREAGSNISQAAELLRIPRSTLRSKMLKYGIAGI